uniref:Gamma-aminobutyric acid type B receptor subunit 2 n=1 Tax=Nematostella vectensis TaxID=45351 RepID=A0A6B7E3G1_NEMVE|nr:GABAB-R1-d [Nematostella vectensis]
MNWHKPSLLIVCILILTNAGFTAKKELYIGGFFPLSGVPVASSGRDILPACKMALEMLNNRSDILPDYRLNLLARDTKCDVGHGIKVLYEYLSRSTPVITLLGPACSAVTKVVAEVAWHWSLLQVSYASTASDLSNKEKYPLLYRTVQPDSAFNSARVSVLEFYGWRRVGTLRQDDFVFSSVMSELHQSLEDHNISVVSPETFSKEPRRHLEAIKDQDARIIIGMFYEDAARRVFCEAYKLGMYGSQYVWILLDWADNHQWWLTPDDDVDCTADQMASAVTGYFSIDSVNLERTDKPGISGLTSKEFLKEFSRYHPNGTANLYVPYAFDSMWMIALALNNTAGQLHRQNKSLDQFCYGDHEMARLLQRSTESLVFRGVTGMIEFSKKGERKQPVWINQLQEWRPVHVGLYDPANNKIMQNTTLPIWQGDGPPSDGLVHYLSRVEHVTMSLLWVTIVLGMIGILLASGFLCFNVRYRNHSYIKLSSPNLNNVIIVGAILIYMSIILVAMDGRTVSPASLTHICTATSYLLGIGYSLAVGAMFSKTWRVHQIFNKVKPKKKVFQDSELIGLVVLMIAVDLVVFSLWAGVDPLTYRLQQSGEAIREGDVMVTPFYESCHSKHSTTWLYIIMGYKGLILLVGCFISWETRKVKVRALNDSRFVGMSVYNIVLAVVIGGPLTLLIGGDRDSFVALYSFFVFFPTSISLCLLFVPKIRKVRKHAEEFLRFQSLSAMRMSSEYRDNSYSSSSTDHVTILRLQTELAQVKRELEHHKATTKTSEDPLPVNRKLSFDQDVRTDHRTTSDENTSRPTRSETCQDLSQFQSTPMGVQRRCNTFSVPDHNVTGSDDGSATLVNLKLENAGLRRELKESKISEAGKMCKILYQNAELNRKLEELSLKQRAGSTDEEEVVSRLMRENTELKRQLGEVSILNSVWCDVTPRLSRKARHDSNTGRDDIKELNKLLTVDLGGAGRSCSFTRLNRLSPIGKSQSSLDQLEPKDSLERPEHEKGEVEVTIMIDDTTSLIDTQGSDSMKEYTKNGHGDGKSGTTSNENISASVNGGFIFDEGPSVTSDGKKKVSRTVNDHSNNTDHNDRSDRGDRNIRSDQDELKNFDELLCEKTRLATQRLLKKPSNNDVTSHGIPPIRRGQIESTASDSGMESAPVSPQHPFVLAYNERMPSTTEAADQTFSKRRKKSKQDRKTHIEKVEKTFFV